MINFVKPAICLNGDSNDSGNFKFYENNTFELNGSIGESYQDVTVLGQMSLTLLNAKADSLEYLKAFGKCEQRNLPEEYTQVNYVTNTAKTWLDTGVKFDFSKNYEIELRVRGTLGSWYILQARENEGSPISGISGSSTNNTIILAFKGSQVATTQVTRKNGNIYYIKGTINNGTLTLYVKDETAGTEETVTGTYTSTTGQSVDIGLLSNGTISSSGGISQSVDINTDVYFARIKENDNYIMDYVPCKQSTTAGFYDEASNTFKTTTDLSAGAEVTPTPDTPMDIWCNNGVLKIRSKSGLPSGYTKLEYVQSDGNSYIDTGVVPDNDTGFSVTLACVATPVDNFIYGAREGANGRFVIGVNNVGATNNYYPGYGSFTSSIWTGIDIFNLNTLKLNYKNSKEASLNDVDKKSIIDYSLPTFDVGTTVTIFGRNSSGTVVGFAQKIYANEITQGTSIAHNYIPSKRNSDGVLGMYDTVSNTFLTNAGTGTFTAGAIDYDDMEIYIDGTQETINVHGKNLFNKNDSDIGDGYISATDGNVTASSRAHTGYFKVIPNTTYHVTLPTYQSGSANGIAFYNSSKTYISGITSNVSYGVEPHTFTVPSNNSIVYARLTLTDIIANTNLNEIQIEQGSTATTYEPYFNGGSLECPMLLSVGSYQDEFILEN